MTRLNTVGTQLAQIPGVHAMTDVTGFGLLGHAWEMARGAQLHIGIDFDQLPWLPQAREFAAQGVVTGASNRHWAAYGAQAIGRAAWRARGDGAGCDARSWR